MPKPIYVVAGQSNAGSILRTGAFQSFQAEAGDDYYVVVREQGGTALGPRWNDLDWYPVADGDPETGELFDALVTGIRAVLAADPEAYLASVIWNQGEADGHFYGFQAPYEDRLGAFVNTLRAAFGEQVAFNIATLSDEPSFWTAEDELAERQIVEDAQRALATGRPGIELIDLDVLTAASSLSQEERWRDHIHYSKAFAEEVMEASLEIAKANLAVVGTSGNDMLHAAA